NPNWCVTAVARDIVDAILKAPANGKSPAVYWSKPEQETRVVAMYKKWEAQGGVWTAAAEKTHIEQLEHVRKGCLARSRNDVRSDGSRIEGSHKGWNGLQRSYASGIESLNALCHDFVLRRNTRIETAADDAPPFTLSAYGSHHVRLVNACAKLWNLQLATLRKGGKMLPAGLHSLPELMPASSGESFGLLAMSSATAAYQSLAVIKEEPEDDLLDLSSQDLLNATRILTEIGVDPDLLQHPLQPAASSSLSVTQNGGASTGDSELSHTNTTRSNSQLTPSLRLISTEPIDVDAAALADSTTKQEDGSNHPEGPVTSSKVRSRSCSHQARNHSNSQISEFFSAQRPGHNTLSSSRPHLPRPTISGLTRSQRVISIATGIDPRSLTFTRGESDAFFLFMRLRKEHRWASFSMTPFDWVCAASRYNLEVDRLKRERGLALTYKTPRALMEKLGEIEPRILARLMSGDFPKTSNNESFWREHCHAVPLGTKISTSEGTAKKRQNHTCNRCKTIMYPGPEGSPLNHKKLCCRDGVRQTGQKVSKVLAGQKVEVVEEPPPFPQPAGVFMNGTHFYPRQFLRAVGELYQRVIVEGNSNTTHAMEDLAFAALLQDCILVIPATASAPPQVLFTLYKSLTLGDCPPELVVEHEGTQYLRIDELSDSLDVHAQALSTGLMASTLAGSSAAIASSATASSTAQASVSSGAATASSTTAILGRTTASPGATAGVSSTAN
ncbi:hypothetical protein GY45DRAFT_1264040, partial [Cubamyces sp. BRFM 1775]